MIGYQFQPDNEKRLRASINGSGTLSPNANQAIKVLALKMPDVLSGRPIAPDDLLKPQVGGAGGRVGDVAGSVTRAVAGGTMGAPPVPERAPAAVNAPAPSSSFSVSEPPAASAPSTPSPFASARPEAPQLTNVVNTALDTPRAPTPRFAPIETGIDDLKRSAGFRQFDPGIYTNDDAYGKGYGFTPDSGASGYRNVSLGLRGGSDRLGGDIGSLLDMLFGK